MKDENLQAHLGSPDFFDLERYPEITFRSTSIRRHGDEVIVDGDLTIKGHTRAVEARGSIAGPGLTLRGDTASGVALETIVDRTEFGLAFNALGSAGARVIDRELPVPSAAEAFDEDGGLKDGDTTLALDSVIAELLDAAKRRLVA